MEWFKITTPSMFVRVAVDEILYILADGNYCDLVLTNGTSHKMTFQLHYFENYFRQLHRNPFFRVGRSVIVNKMHVRIVDVPKRCIHFGGHTVDTRVLHLQYRKADETQGGNPLRGRTALFGSDILKELKNEMTTYED